MKDYYSEMTKAAVGTTFHCWKNDVVVNFAKIGRYDWSIITNYVLNEIGDGKVLRFNTICTTMEASEFRKLCTED